MTRARLVLAAFVAVALAVDSHAASPQLAQSASAFVRSQSGSEINWELWDPGIAARAKAENKPVYVYIGSFLSELSRSTTQQIFTQPDNIKYLNEHFVCVIADREEQPELAVTLLSKTVEASGLRPLFKKVPGLSGFSREVVKGKEHLFPMMEYQVDYR